MTDSKSFFSAMPPYDSVEEWLKHRPTAARVLCTVDKRGRVGNLDVSARSSAELREASAELAAIAAWLEERPTR